MQQCIPKCNKSGWQRFLIEQIIFLIYRGVNLLNRRVTEKTFYIKVEHYILSILTLFQKPFTNNLCILTYHQAYYLSLETSFNVFIYIYRNVLVLFESLAGTKHKYVRIRPKIDGPGEAVMFDPLGESL